MTEQNKIIDERKKKIERIGNILRWIAVVDVALVFVMIFAMRLIR